MLKAFVNAPTPPPNVYVNESYEEVSRLLIVVVSATFLLKLRFIIPL